MKEPKENVITICPDCAAKRKAEVQTQLETVFLIELIGKYIKKGFYSEKNEIEHMWVKIQSVEEDRQVLIGSLANDPYLCNNWRYGDRVVVNKSEIEDVA